MVNISLSVSYLSQYEQLVAAAVPQAAAAFAPFGVRFQSSIGYKLNDDPANSANGWTNLISQLTQNSAKANPPSPAHLVVTLIPPGADPTINGQLLERMRGICAVFLGANTFQTPNPESRMDLVVQVMVHELGHLMDLTHGDDQGAGYPSAMTPTEERLPYSPMEAWKAALTDAASRGEPVINPPKPVIYYPFGTLCRACLRQASLDAGWLPWRTAFRGNFDLPREDRDQSLGISVRHQESSLQTHVDDGLAFTLELQNNGDQPVYIPIHIGPEFGTLRVEIQCPEGETRLFRPAQLRCSNDTYAILPGEKVLRSFSLIPHPDDRLFASPGLHTCLVSILIAHGPRALSLGSQSFEVDVTAPTAGVAGRRSAALIASGHVHAPDVLGRTHGNRVRTSRSSSAAVAHAKYKLALAEPEATNRIKALTRCIDSSAPPAVRHRAARRLAFERLLAGEAFNVIAASLRQQFDRPEDVELHQTLQRMGNGWNTLRT